MSEAVLNTLKAVFTMLWVTGVMIGGAITSGNAVAFLTGAGALLLALAVPAFIGRIANGARYIWARFQREEDEDAVP